MGNITDGKAKYARKTAPGGTGEAKYNAAKGQMVSNWQKGLAAAGLPPGPLTTQAYQNGISNARYTGGDPNKWEANLRAAMSR